MSDIIFKNLPALIIVLPILVAPILALMPARDGWRSTCWLISYLVSSLVFACAGTLLLEVLEKGAVLYSMGNWPPPIGIEYRATPLNAFILLIISLVNFAVLSFAAGSVEREIPRLRIPLFYACIMLCFSGLMGMVIANDIFNIFVFLEISSLTAYALVSLGKKRAALTAAFNYLIMGTVGGTFFLFGIGLLYAHTGTLNISDIAARISGNEDSRVLAASAVFLLVGLCIKSAVFPFAGWLPRVYSNAPSAVSVLLAATATKVALYLIIRVIYEIFGTDFIFGQLQLNKILILLAALGVIFGSIAACFQNDVKRMLAFSSIANVGYILLGISIASSEALTSSLILFLSHAVAKGGLFLFCGIVVSIYGSSKITNFSGMGKTAPALSALVVVLCLSLLGTPLTSGFLSKWYLLMGGMNMGGFTLAVTLVAVAIGTLCAVIYLFRIIEMLYFHEPAKAKHAADYTTAPLYLFVGITIVIGIYPSALIDFFSKITEGFGL